GVGGGGEAAGRGGGRRGGGRGGAGGGGGGGSGGARAADRSPGPAVVGDVARRGISVDRDVGDFPACRARGSAPDGRLSLRGGRLVRGPPPQPRHAATRGAQRVVPDHVARGLRRCGADRGHQRLAGRTLD